MIQITNPRRLVIFLLVVVLIIFGSAWLLVGGHKILHSGDLVIAEGSSAKQTWQQLKDKNFTASTLPWRYYAWRQAAADKIKAGSYHLAKGESVPDVMNRFVAGDTNPDELTVTYPEGFTIQQIADRTAAKNIGTPEEFIAAASPPLYIDQYPYLVDIPAGRDLEGYLFPDTYKIFVDDTPPDIIKRLLANFDNKLTPELRTQAASSGRTVDQIVILASIIEREVTSPEDMATVSGILWKRFDNSAGLDVDATVRYALKKWNDPLTYQDLQTDSPYNTRKYRGLPPGPISNPGLQALVAAVQPKTTDYYYYLSAPEGQTVFSKTNDEHNANKAKYLK
ncbi:MAG: endolytic transglycosylase MltG [Candidatus Andersenbacteria bacterium]|nr:endolytic transglycosylase MltG [bacterium]MDZ4225495.1 endolytic transglycosylase MltG [Candidatus Andersenbacteria bacterium]